MEVAILDLKPFLYSGLKKPETLLGSVKLSEDSFTREIVYCGGVAYLIKFIRDQLKGYNVIGCMDSISSFRRKLYPKYKANRQKRLSKEEQKKMNDNIELMGIVMDYVGIPMCIKQDFEADDLIASAVKSYGNAEHITIYTPDSDLRCWISSKVSIGRMNSRTRNIEFTSGIPYKCISIYKAVYGDESDNIPPAPEPNIKKLFDVLPNEDILLDVKKLLSLSKILFPNNKNLHRNIQLALQVTDIQMPLSLPVVKDTVLARINKANQVLSGYEQDLLLEREWISKMQL